MFRKIITSLLLLAGFTAAQSQELNKFDLTISTDSASFISITAKKVWSKQAAAPHRQQLELAAIASTDGFGRHLEWYNLSGKDNKTPAALNGTNTGIAAISFDKEQFDKCNSNTDLARMTGHITKNSFSHFAVISNDKKLTQHCFIIEMENGKRGLIYLTEGNEGSINAAFKIQE
jgi:hypothetical protein